MTRRTRNGRTSNRHTRSHRPRPPGLLIVEGVRPGPTYEHRPFLEAVLGFAMDQRAFGPRQLMVAFGDYEGRFLGLMYTDRTHPIDDVVEVCLLHFEQEIGGVENGVAAVVLCDQRVVDASCRPKLEAMFERATVITGSHGVHLVDWIGCDDDTFCSVRLGRSGLDPSSTGGTCLSAGPDEPSGMACIGGALHRGRARSDRTRRSHGFRERSDPARPQRHPRRDHHL